MVRSNINQIDKVNESNNLNKKIKDELVFLVNSKDDKPMTLSFEKQENYDDVWFIKITGTDLYLNVPYKKH